MNKNIKITLLIILIFAVAGGGVLLYFSIKTDKRNICQKLNDKYKLTGDKMYKEIKEETLSGYPICCPSLCDGNCMPETTEEQKKINIDKSCLWTESKDPTGGEDISSLPKSCNDILNGKFNVGQVCYMGTFNV